MPVSKVVYGGNTVIDLTGDTVAADKLGAGVTAHGADGSAITGTGLLYTESADLTPIVFDYNVGYIALTQSSNIALAHTYYFAKEEPTQCYCDVYELTAGKHYSLSLDSVVGTRFRAGMAKTYTDFNTTVNNRQAITLRQVVYLADSPTANQRVFFLNDLGTAAYPYLIVQKDNKGRTGLITHLRELTFN